MDAQGKKFLNSQDTFLVTYWNRNIYLCPVFQKTNQLLGVPPLFIADKAEIIPAEPRPGYAG